MQTSMLLGKVDSAPRLDWDQIKKQGDIKVEVFQESLNMVTPTLPQTDKHWHANSKTIVRSKSLKPG